MPPDPRNTWCCENSQQALLRNVCQRAQAEFTAIGARLIASATQSFRCLFGDADPVLTYVFAGKYKAKRRFARASVDSAGTRGCRNVSDQRGGLHQFSRGGRTERADFRSAVADRWSATALVTDCAANRSVHRGIECWRDDSRRGRRIRRWQRCASDSRRRTAHFAVDACWRELVARAGT